MTEQADSKSKQSSNTSVQSRQNRTFQDKEIERMLVSGEEVVLRAKLHNAIYWKSIAVLILSILVYLYVAHPLGLLLMVVGGLMLIIEVITKHYLLLAITNKRVLARYGLLQMDVVDIRFSKIESIDLERMLPGHLFGYATVVVMGTGQRYIRIPYIANAEAFRRYHNEITLAKEGIHQDEVENLPDPEQKKNAKKRPSKAK